MAEKVNPFAKLAAEKSEDGTVPSAAVKELVEKSKVPAKKRTVKAKAAPEPEAPETDEVVELEGTTHSDVEGRAAVLESEDNSDDEDGEEEEVATKPDTKVTEPAKTTKRRTAAVVEAEAAEREAALQRQIDEMKAALAGKADAADVPVTVVRDRIVLEGGQGGDVRVVGDGRTLVNDSWRATADGLRLLVGRSSAQSTQTFQFPISLVPALAELLSNIEEITD